MLELRELPIPQPQAGELLVKVHAASLNRGEFLSSPSLAQGGGAAPAGSDCAGEVSAIGAGVAGWKIGDRVMGTARGAYAEYAILDVRLAHPVSDQLSWEQAAAAPITFMVTHDMLWANGHLQAGEWLLVTGISSGVGVACLQSAKAIGAKVIGTSGSRAKLDRLKPLGLDVAIETRKPDFAQAVLDATAGKGADLVVNNVGGSVFAECVRCMAFQGRLATVGYLDRTFKAEIDLARLHSQRLHVFGVSAKHRPVHERAAMLVTFRRDLLPLLNEGRIKPLVDKIFTLEDLPKARAYMESDAQVGKIVLKVN
jgi:NADPH:quinone reductase-like Zn-dependent oxidoreductase